MGDCANCGHYKKNHSMIGKKHLGECNFHTMFGGKAQPTCECKAYLTSLAGGKSNE